MLSLFHIPSRVFQATEIASNNIPTICANRILLRSSLIQVTGTSTICNLHCRARRRISTSNTHRGQSSFLKRRSEARAVKSLNPFWVSRTPVGAIVRINIRKSDPRTSRMRLCFVAMTEPGTCREPTMTSPPFSAATSRAIAWSTDVELSASMKSVFRRGIKTPLAG